MHLNQYSNLVSRLLASSRSFEPPPVASVSAPAELESGSLTELLGDSIIWHQTLPPTAPQLTPIPRSLPPQLRVALSASGIDQLYSHQLKCLQAVRRGKDVVVCTSTSSGKSLAAYLPILEGILTNDRSALSFYSLKALASDQGDKLVSLLDAIPPQDRPQLAVLNGDLSLAEREARLAQRPSIVGATPELIHYALARVYRHQPWQEFLRRLRYVLLDEAHTYRGAFGANMANLIARLMLAVDTVGGCSRQLQFLFLSATVGNPVGVAKRLTRRKRRTADGTKRIICLTESGAATPERELIVTRPTANPNPDTARIILFLLGQGLRGLCFCNGREALKSLLSTLHSEASTQNSPDAARVALFYGGLTQERRARTIEQLDTGAIRCLLSTSALEAGIDLAALDFAIVRGWPNSLGSFRQRIGRAGRHQRGLALFIPNALSPLDQYYARHPHLLLESPPERVSFNPSYPLDLAKHLLCAAAESNIPRRRLGYYFGKGAARVAHALIEQNLLRANRNDELWAKGRFHRDVNFRGGATSGTVALVASDSGETIETTPLDTAQREVFPGALYRTQDEAGQLVTYRSLGLENHRAVLQRVPDTRTYTSADSELDACVQHELVPDTTLQLSLDGLDPSTEPPAVQLGLSWCQISQKVTGYQTLTRQYELTCLNPKCVSHRTPLPQQKLCPACSQRTRRAELVTVVDENRFEDPLTTCFSTTIAQVSFNRTVRDYLCARTEQIKQELVASEGLRSLQSEPLWEYSAPLLALHSFGHQLLAALPLVVLCAPSDVSFIVQKNAQGLVGGFYDLSEGGNGTSEAIWRHLQPLASAAAGLARNCPCTDGCPRCLILPGCPDDNRALSKRIGLLLCDAVASASR